MGAALAAVLALGTLAACGGDEQPPVAQAPVLVPGTPGGEATTIAPGEVVPTVGKSVAPADIAFVTGMIPHHEQALTLAALAPDRAGNASVKGLASRIADVQTAEIAVYERWLADQGLGRDGRPDGRKDDHSGHGSMPMAGHGMSGMASDADIARLEASSGAAFDKLWLQLMIAHHEGAITMARARDDDGGLDETTRQMAADVTADQLAEIRRMDQVLAQLG